MKRLPSLHGAVVNDRLRCASNRNVDNAVANVVARDTEGMGCRRARTAGCKCRTLHAEFDANVCASRGTYDAQQRQRVGCALPFDKQRAIGVLKGHETASARANDAGRAVGISDRELKARLLNCLVGRRSGKPRVTVGVYDKLIAFEVLQPRLGIKILDLRCNQNFEIFKREPAKVADAALAGLH